jgi:hypothetical protein
MSGFSPCHGISHAKCPSAHYPKQFTDATTVEIGLSLSSAIHLRPSPGAPHSILICAIQPLSLRNYHNKAVTPEGDLGLPREQLLVKINRLCRLMRGLSSDTLVLQMISAGDGFSADAP